MHTNHFAGEDSIFYRIEYGLESKYLSLEDMMKNLPKVYKPTPPISYLPEEEVTTPRISVCKSVFDCFSALTYRRFAKCSWSCGDEHAEYNQDEAYPILLVAFKNPTTVMDHTELDDMVPDAYLTHECWILSEEVPHSVDLIWLDRNSLSWKFHEDPEIKPWGVFEECIGMVPCMEPKLHPWLTPNQGSPLLSEFPPGEFWRLLPQWCPKYDPLLIPFGELFYQMYDELCQGSFIPEEE